MSPAEAIAMLDRALAANGEDVVLRRMTHLGTTSTPADRPGIRAHVRGYRPDELVGNIAQGDRQVILSPSGLDGDLPKRGDLVLIAGRSCMIEAAAEIRVGGVVVRIELQVKG
ncbi:hypothetical protein ACO2RV_04575 [Ancylobacter sp. VNQ12]|uniref:hypothetical protein n=1 Tax=Ancylobacter sp. VNQ12 TaxID=3400920 RepID=UPI003C10DE6E